MSHTDEGLKGILERCEAVAKRELARLSGDSEVIFLLDTKVPAVVRELLEARNLLTAVAGIIESKWGPDYTDEIRAFLGGDDANS